MLLEILYWINYNSLLNSSDKKTRENMTNGAATFMTQGTWVMCVREGVCYMTHVTLLQFEITSESLQITSDGQDVERRGHCW